ncbi:MAG: O-antigen ligase family protein [Actinobacteria bacterium]|nr:O-antigen ligase family protein [Actinomycetota bacterium]
MDKIQQDLKLDFAIQIAIIMLVVLVPLGQIVRYVITFFLILFWLGKSVKNKKLEFFYSSFYVPLIFLFFIGTISGIVNFTTGINLFKEIFLAFEYIMFFWIGFNFIRKKDDISNMVQWLTYGAIIISSIAILQCFILVDPFLRWGYEKHIFSIINHYRAFFTSVFNNPNVFGEYLVIVFPVIYSILSYEKNKIGKLILPVLLVSLIIAGSHGSYFGLFLGMIIFYVFRYKVLTNPEEKIKEKKRIKWLVWSISLILIIIASLAFSGYREQSFIQRAIIWKTSWKIFKAHPWLGVGFENFGKVFPEFVGHQPVLWMYTQAHNIFFQFLTETGILGFLAVLWLIIKVIRDFIKNYRGITNRFLQIFAIGCFSSFCGCLTNSMTDWVFATREFAFLFFFFIGILYSIYAIGNT